MAASPRPPDTFTEFARKFPGLAAAWKLAGEAGRAGPLGDRACRLVKLAVAVGALREGAVHSAVRRALAAGVTPAEVEQVVALSASTIGFPAAVAAYTWVRDVVGQGDPAAGADPEAGDDQPGRPSPGRGAQALSAPARSGPTRRKARPGG
jgi:alkylhydroperoxidase/carboxymuconolactone decarboxylase family protein YurZ